MGFRKKDHDHGPAALRSWLHYVHANRFNEFSTEAVDVARDLIGKAYGAQYLPDTQTL